MGIQIQENLVDLIGESVRQNWARPALADWEGKGLTYGQVADEIAHLHEVFRICHVAPGDKIALLGRNSASWAVVWLATVTYGAVIVPILPDFRPDDVHHIVNHSDAALLFVADALFTPLDPEQLLEVGAVFSLADFRLLHCGKESLAKSLAETMTRSRGGRRLQDHEGVPPGADGRDDLLERGAGSQQKCIIHTVQKTLFRGPCAGRRFLE